MKRIILQVPALNNKKISLNMPIPSVKDKDVSNIFKLINGFNILFLSVVFILLPFSYKLYSEYSFEGSLLVFFSKITIVSFTLFVVSKYLILKDKNKDDCISTPYILPVLVFALITSIPSLIVENSSYNSFGSIDIKAFSALTIILLIGIFSIFTNLSFSKKSFDFIRKSFLYSLIIFSLTSFFIDTNGLEILPLILSVPLLIMLGLKSKNYYYIYFLGAITFSYRIFEKDLVSNDMFLQIIFSALIASFSLLAIVLFFRPRYFLVSIKNIKSSFTRFSKSLKNSESDIAVSFQETVISIIKLLILISPFLLLLLLLVASMNSNYNSSFILDAKDSFQRGFKLIDNSTKELLMGIGAGDKGLGITNVRTSKSFFENILRSGGLVNFIGYLFLFATFIFASGKSFKESLQLKNNSKVNIYAFNLFVTIFLFILSFFIYIGLYSIIILWVILALNVIDLRIKKSNINNLDFSNSLPRFKFLPNDKERYLHYSLILGILLLGVFSLVAYSKILENI
ncbi:MAG: hypothetical protein Q9M91_07460 [Candidatus Dojkabacteria bacterium]|nr:hypothetical protein [Candidatus Dojkabacteria bacterium]MDQ7021623.1 hypothetical protein [Candidatus Dojkabacteria bacterium]